MKRAIITGATGFIGSWLTLELLNENWETVLIVRNPAKLLPEVLYHPNCVLVHGDLRTVSAKGFPQADYDAFYNLSWIGVSSEQKNDFQVQLSNIPMALRALELSNELKCKLFISAGTVAEYALTSDVIDLHAEQSPSNMYGAAKVSTYYFLKVFARELNQPFIWTVIPSTFGERQTDKNSIVTYTIKYLLTGERPKYGNLEQMWDFLYISEVVRALRLIGEKGKAGKVYGIGSGQYKPLHDYIVQIRDIINPELELGIGEIDSMSKRSYSSCVNNYELIKDTGFQPLVSFEEGIRRTICYWSGINEGETVNDT